MQAYCTDEGWFSSVADNGITGIFETPTARIMNENHFRIMFNQAEPYRNYGVSVSLYNRVELSGRFVEILNSDMTELSGDTWDGYGNYKDKFVAGKFKIIDEDKYMPQIAIGLNDPTGTKLYGAQYVVLSKQIYPFDFSFGMGIGRFGDKKFDAYGKKDILLNFVYPKEYIKSGNPFFSVNFRPSKNYSFIYEYSPVDFDVQTQDPAVKFGGLVSDSPHNYGARYYFSENIYGTLSYQRGNAVGFGITMPFEIGKPVVPIYDARPAFANISPMVGDFGRIQTAVLNSGYGDTKIVISGSNAYISADNRKYFYEEDAIEALAYALSRVDVKNVTDYNVTVVSSGVQMYNFTFDREMLELYKEGKIGFDEFYAYSKVNTIYKDDSIFDNVNSTGNAKYFFGVKPQINFYLNDPSGFFKGSYGVRGWAGTNVSSSLSLIAGIAYYPLNDISTVNESKEEAVRSDVSDFINKKLLLDNVIFNWNHRISKTPIYVNVEGGILETEYAGATAEVGVPFFDNKFMLGIGVAAVNKRDPENYLGIQQEKSYETGFLKSRVHFKKIGTYADIDVGRFLGGDVGAKLKVTKDINGVLLSVWYTKTDTSVFQADFNRGYSDSGIMVTVPFRLFKGKETQSSYGQAISPWTRDVGAQVSEHTEIFDFIDKHYVKKH